MNFGPISLIPPTFNILSLGERGTGKTVFLVGSYAEFQQVLENQRQIPKIASDLSDKLWFECQYKNEKYLLNNILQYVLKRGAYPPPTLKITDFHFAFKQKKDNQRNTLCYIRWWDMLGEYCNFANPYYQEMAVNSQSCCVFINTPRLLYDTSYQEIFDYLKKQILTLIAFVRDQDKDYPFSLIFTQCDLLPHWPEEQQIISEYVQELTAHLDKAGVNYRCFYSTIRIKPDAQAFRLVSNDVSSVFLWLVTELYEHYRGGSLANLKTLSILHCLSCGSDRVNPSRSIAFLKKLGFLLTLRRKYRCRDCGASKIEFLPFVWLKEVRNLFSSKKR
ncbi:MAG: hypothetical protein VKJ02_05190 [Snowella sp.]|nr:hypothetical protein [Snowella sp.]